MFTAEMLQDAVDVFRENDYWREYYDTAPSKECKFRIALSFANSLYHPVEVGKFKPIREKAEEPLKLEDWEHLCKYAGNNPWKGLCRQKIKELGGKV